jgi:TRAP-type C4-dicarboxylate transport system permease small subunit
MADTANDNSPARAGPVRALVEGLALAGGVILFCVACLVTANVTARGTLDTSIDGTFDLVKIGAALCVFLFLPLCQARSGNIMVDTFTKRLPVWFQRGLDALWDGVYGVLMGTIGICMLIGAHSQYQSRVVTTQLAVPLWPFNLAAALLLLALAVICVLTMRDKLSRTASGRAG